MGVESTRVRLFFNHLHLSQDTGPDILDDASDPNVTNLHPQALDTRAGGNLRLKLLIAYLICAPNNKNSLIDFARLTIGLGR